MRVLGLDPGTRITGWGVVSDRLGRSTAEAFGLMHPPRTARTRAQLLAAIAGQIEALLAEHRPDVVAIETPFLGRFARAALGLAEVRGAMLVALGRWGGEILELEPAAVKAATVGYGRAEKRQVAYVVQHELGLPAPPPEDAADALALALCHLRGEARRAAAARA